MHYSVGQSALNIFLWEQKTTTRTTKKRDRWSTVTVAERLNDISSLRILDQVENFSHSRGFIEQGTKAQAAAVKLLSGAGQLCSLTMLNVMVENTMFAP